MKLTVRMALAGAGVVLLAFAVFRLIVSDSPAVEVASLSALVLVVALLAVMLTRHWVVRPIDTVGQAIRRIARGEVPEIDTTGTPEIDSLVEAIQLLDDEIGGSLSRLRHGQRSAAALIEAMSEGVMAADLEGTITLANPAARHLLGFAAEAELPALPLIFQGVAASEAVNEAIRQLLHGEPIRDMEFSVGDYILLLNANPFEAEGVLIVLHDLTELRRLENVRRDFISNASHELRTPLTSIVGYAETLHSDMDEMDAATRTQFMATILSNAQRMHQLVDELLDLSRIESGRWIPNPADVDIADAAQASWELVESHAQARNTTLTVSLADNARSVYADSETVRQLFSNLFDNALRHIGENGSITVRSAAQDGGILLSIQDNGSGIPTAHLPRIFERFYRVDRSRQRADGGTGLGLSIIKHQVESHRGRVWAESEPGQGTVIHCWFPGER